MVRRWDNVNKMKDLMMRLFAALTMRAARGDLTENVDGLLLMGEHPTVPCHLKYKYTQTFRNLFCCPWPSTEIYRKTSSP